MHLNRALATLLSGAALVAGCLGVAGCSSDSQTGAAPEAAYSVGDVIAVASSAGVDSEDVAAVVDGRVITQECVDAQVRLQRVTDGLEDDAAYEAYLKNAGLTEWDRRREAIAQLVRDTLIEIDAEKRGIELSDEEVSQAIDALESRYPSHASWLEALSASGYDETGYEHAVRVSMLSSRLSDAVVTEYEPTDEEIEQYAVAFAPTLAGRRSSMILFSQDDYELAKQVRQQIEDGADFAEMACEYSIDGTAADGGDVGWDSLSSFVPEYEDALSKLNPGDVSPVVRSRFGYHIILCTERYQPSYESDGSIDLTAIPSDLMDIIVSSIKTSLADEEFNNYVSGLAEDAAMAIFDADGVQVPLEEFGVAEKDLSAEEGAQTDDAGQDVLPALPNDTVLNAPLGEDGTSVPDPEYTAAVTETLPQE